MAARHGIGQVELRAACGTVDLPAALAGEFGTPAAFAAAAQSVRIIALDTSLFLPGDAAALAAFLQYIPWAEALGGVKLRVFDGAAGVSVADLVASVATLNWWHKMREKNNWRSDVMVETHSSLVTSSKLKEFIAEAPSGTSILWDTHHTWRIGGESPEATWENIAPNIVHLHVKDSITCDTAEGKYKYVLPGAGEYPMRTLLNTLRKSSFEGSVSLEWEKMWHSELPSLNEALDAAKLKGW
ncbi:sugar phosphate isomerase/epimerase family protein [Termitidicoccus mucosus]|uniref:sugar phosphate isomerase/epimerase family protein n=1 Tax=Termitidicoccus mucosus TaxID=1184151 RepID=UPI002FEDE7CB